MFMHKNTYTTVQQLKCRLFYHQ